jgi:hypothetical protein
MRPTENLTSTTQNLLISEAGLEEEYNDVMAREEVDEAVYIDT